MIEAAPLVAGATLVAGEALLGVTLDVAGGRLVVDFERTRIEARELVATTLLAPWDGAPGVAEWLRVEAVQGGETCLELRMRFTTVPRHYRIAARQVTVSERPRDGAS